MKAEEQRIAIAEACGWKRVPERDHLMPDGVLQALPECFVHDEEETVWSEHDLPDYLHDLNAMHEAEKSLTDYCGNEGQEYSQQDDYAETLLGIVGTWNKPKFKWGMECVADFFKIANATAPQRAEAFLRAIGKWVEE